MVEKLEGTANLKTISTSLFDDCYFCATEIGQLSGSEAKCRAREHSLRHAHTVRAIVDHIERMKERPVRILNASGFSYGAQVISMARYLQSNNIEFSWTNIESPMSRFLRNECLNRELERLRVKLVLTDISEVDCSNFGSFHIVIFTEMAEHLDYTVFLQALRGIYEVLEEKGILILTTPNFLSLKFRIKILIGKTHNIYFDDSYSNMEQGLYGHIMYYDKRRLERILEDAGYSIVQIYTYNCSVRVIDSLKSLIAQAIRALSFLPNVGESLFVVAEKPSLRG